MPAKSYTPGCGTLILIALLSPILFFCILGIGLKALVSSTEQPQAEKPPPQVVQPQQPKQTKSKPSSLSQAISEGLAKSDANARKRRLDATAAQKHALENPIPRFNLKIEHIVVKPVGSKWRYFFRIINNDPERKYSGSVTITFRQSNNSRVFAQTFHFKENPLFAEGGGTVVYTDLHTGYTEEYGDFRIAKFTYEWD